jgi:hypothetical protein
MISPMERIQAVELKAFRLCRVGIRSLDWVSTESSLTRWLLMIHRNSELSQDGNVLSRLAVSMTWHKPVAGSFIFRKSCCERCTIYEERTMLNENNIFKRHIMSYVAASHACCNCEKSEVISAKILFLPKLECVH